MKTKMMTITDNHNDNDNNIILTKAKRGKYAKDIHLNCAVIASADIYTMIF